MPKQFPKVTEEEIIEIKRENKRKLDEILSMPDYMVYLGKKYYGERWFTIFDNDHFMKIEHNKQVQKFGAKVRKYMDRPLIQLDMEGKFVKEWKSARAWADENKDELKNPYSAAQHIGKVATGKGETAYGFKWRFKEDE